MSEPVASRTLTRAAYGSVSWWDKIHLTTVLTTAFVSVSLKNVLGLLLFRSTRDRTRTSVRTLGQYAVLCNHSQLQSFVPTSLGTYTAWAKQQNMPLTIENLIDNTTLLWIGPKRTDRVVIYIHGGGYVLPLQTQGLAFWKYVKDELKKNDGLDVGFVSIAYDLVPTAGFKQQLRQVIIGVEHVLASGVEPQNVHLVGDSAGGGLVMGLLSHLLHPLRGLRPVIGLKAPIGGVYVMSPWIHLKAHSTKVDEHTTSRNRLNAHANAVLEHAQLSDEELPYLEADMAPEGWFRDLHKVVGRFLITAGSSDAELRRDELVAWAARMKEEHKETTFILQEGGEHSDPLLDFFFGTCDPKDVGSLTPGIISWLAIGYGR